MIRVKWKESCVIRWGVGLGLWERFLVLGLDMESIGSRMVCMV